MQHVAVIGPTTATRYPALDTGETWKGNPVMAFRARDLAHLIENGVEIDPEAWTLNYGVVGAPDIRADVRAYIADLTTSSSAPLASSRRSSDLTPLLVPLAPTLLLVPLVPTPLLVPLPLLEVAA